MYTGIISVGYSLDMIIPESSVINLGVFNRGGSRYRDFISCFTTQGFENPVWVITDNGFSSGPLMMNRTIMLGGRNVSITIQRVSLYQSDIDIDANGAQFTGNLTCRSQNNPQAQYTVVITTSKRVPFYL